MLAFVGVSLNVHGAPVLQNFSCALSPGECIVVQGKSGAGKSALLSLLLREFDPSEGAVEVDGVDMRMLPAGVLQLYRQRLGVAFEEPNLLGMRTVLENVMLPAELRGVLPNEAAQQGLSALTRLGIRDLAPRFPETLSAGKKRLVSLARAFCGSPQILLLDEPTAHLDRSDRTLLLSACAEAKRAGTSVLIVTSDGADCAPVADRTLAISSETSEMPALRPSATPGATTVKVTAISGG